MYRKFETIIENKNQDNLISNKEDLEISNYMLLDDELTFSKQTNIERVYLDLEKALKSKDSKHNLVLNEGDSIIIAKTMDLVHISGELINLQGTSISAPYFKGKRADYYVKNFAGGFGKSNDRSNTLVDYPNGIVKKSKNFLLFKLSPKVSKGSTIRVSSKNKKEKRKKNREIDWNQQIENAMLKLSAILTLWVLADRVQTQ
jgi:hypothetical protein